jgi:4-amino-4-deoxy-L-arabinose transferase-like glycosyltransferase
MAEKTKTGEDGPRALPNFVWLMFAVLVVFVYFFGLTIPFVGPDEPRYAQVAREMLARGDWITPTLGGLNWFEKPVLLYWLEIVSYKIFGVSEFAARVGPAFFGLGTVACLWLLGRTAANNEPRTTNTYPNWLALIAATTLGILVFARGASFDIIVTFPMTAALTGFFMFDRSREAAGFNRRYLPLIAFYVFTGVALLAKGLIGIVFPLGIIAVFYLLSRRLPSRTFLLSLIWGTLLSVAIAAIWYLPMYERHGYGFIDEFIIQQHFQRFVSNKYRHPQPFYFFSWILPLMTLPWLPFFFASIWNSVKEKFIRRGTETQRQSNTISPPLLVFAVSWLLVPLVFFSFSGSKLPGYILPAVPAAVVLASLLIYDLVTKSKAWQTTILLIAGSTLIGTLLLLQFAVPRLVEEHSVQSLINAADQRGYTTNRVLTMHTASMNAEFYAAGRLLKDNDGKQRWLSGADEVEAVVRAELGKTVLVLVPIEYSAQLIAYERLRSEYLADNGELAIVAVSPK